VTETIKIQKLGSHGDGVGVRSDAVLDPATETTNDPDGVNVTRLSTVAPDRYVFVPFALPGESWALTRDGDATCVHPSPERQGPKCPHYTRCGGCVAQHMPHELYLEWKRKKVSDALAAHGVSGHVGPVVFAGDATRRRAVFTARRTGRRTAFGFHQRAANDIVDVRACAILVPQIANRLERLRGLAELLVLDRADMRLTVTAADSGLDVAVTGARKSDDPQLRRELSDVAHQTGIARLIVNGQDVVTFVAPTVQVDGVEVAIPSGGFLQASEPAEREMIRLVNAATDGAKTVADLFCGLGTFALALSSRAKALACDSDRQAMAALDRAWRNVQGRKAIETRVRDLFREPLSRKELEPFAAVVFDPPRAGARAQAEALAKSRVPLVAAVSCSPATFARDASILVDGGYALDWVTPVDQFVYSDHIELVAAFSKPKSKPRRRR